MDLLRQSIAIILQNQAPGGAFVASPNFATYRYCWFRDGSFVAYALDLAGEHAAAARFHSWAAEAINRRADVAERAIRKAQQGQKLEGDYLHTRYRLDGTDATEQEWADFQLDGFGTWLWALEQHCKLADEIAPADWLRAARLTADYLEALWRLPCYDCWEELPDKVHPASLAAIHGGLGAAARLGQVDRGATQAAICDFIGQQGTYDGYFTKFCGSYTVDASLLGLAVPYNVVGQDDPRMRETVRRIERSLWHGGGVHRYTTDTYYGGGAWVLLAAWLGWYHALAGDTAKAQRLRAWIESLAGEHGELPEQVPETLIDENYYEPWVRRWGPPANPLLWSQAQYVILCHVLGVGPAV